MDNGKQLKVGVIGQGRSGRSIHARVINMMPDKFKIAAVVDALPERRQKAIEDFGCDAYESHEALYDRTDLDLIVNATPSHLHVPLSLEFLQRGFNVLCEKPLARKASEVDLLIEAAEKSGKLLAVYQQSRFSPSFMKVKEIIDSGVIGRVVQVSVAFNGFGRRWDWQTLKKYNGGNLLNTGPHPMDQALQFYGTDIMPKITCLMDKANSFGDAEDYVRVIMYGNGRPTVDVEISSCCTYPNFNYHVQGTNGGIKGTFTHLDWKYFKPEEAPGQSLVETPLHNDDGSPAYCSEELKWYEESWDLPEHQKDLFKTMSTAFYNNLYDALVNGAPLVVTPQHVRQQIAVMEECFRQNPQFA